MDMVIKGIEAGDVACMTIGVEFIEEDKKFPFGRTLKSNTARALRRMHLPPNLVARIQGRVLKMLIAGNTPSEYHEYAKLLRKIGFERLWLEVEAGVPRSNKYAMRYFEYFRAIHECSPAVVASKRQHHS